jgi:hypothetical protein
VAAMGPGDSEKLPKKKQKKLTEAYDYLRKKFDLS